MTSKERVLAAIAHQPVDRVPMDYAGNLGIDSRLRRHFGIADSDPDRASKLLEALGIDFRGVGARYTGAKLHADLNEIKVDNWGVRRRWVEHASGGYWDYCEWPLARATVDEIDAWPMPDPDDFDYRHVAEECRRLSGYCVTLGHAGIGDIINSCGMLRTMEQVLVDLMLDDPAGMRLVERRHAIQLEILRRTLEASDGMIDLVYIGEDLGTQRGPTISLDLFRRQIRPRMQQFVDLARAFGKPVMVHSCGSSSWAFDDFIEMGISVVDTLQPEAADMAPAYLKQRFGGALAFHGCISTAGPLATGTVDQVRANVRETLEIMMPGGGYILSPTHAIQDNSPTENVLAMYQAGRE
jgi:uroporphyrinogen decarboxylase